MNYSAPTPPSPTTRVILAQKSRRRRWLVILLALFFVPLFCCGTSLLIYLIIPPAPVNILVLGTDGRAGEGFFSRTDSMMVVGVKPSQLRLSLLSIPRDIFIEVPGYGSQRINTVNVLGEQAQAGSGPQLVMSAISQDFGIRLERYIRLDFNGFVKLVDAAGGLTIDVERTIIDDSYPTEDGGYQYIQFDAGVQQMDGERALIYARTRHGDDDYQRAARQQQVISALFGKLINPLRWPAALGVIQSSVDTNLTPWDMFTIVVPAALNRGRYEQLVVNRDYILGSPGGNAVPNYDLLNPWIQEHLR
ncbi:MAG: LCP family protein [Chloroflexi bacterium]|nr:LCP family protein [Chloroflexota bacterium]MCC6895610.1 LCP family protein [Anaerolineae bacterium]